MIALMILTYVLICATDFLVWYKVFRLRPESPSRRIYAVLTAVSDSLPLLSWIVERLASDNTPAVVAVMMWMTTIYIILVLPRMVMYLFLPFSHRRTVRIAAAAAAAVTAAVLLYGLFAGRRNIEVKEIEIVSERIPEAFDGFRIVQFSDLHIGTMLCPHRETEAVAAVINGQDADMVVFSGDLVSIRHTELDERCMALLSDISAPYGVWTSAGNHDTGIYVKDSVALPKPLNKELLFDKISALGWRMVNDTTVYVRRGGDSISLSGVAFSERLYDVRHSAEIGYTDISDVYEDVPPQVFNITISHLPQLWESIIACGYGDLTLSGHVHGMQTNVRIAGVDFSPARIFYRRWSGLYSLDGRYLYINNGIGYVGMYMRIGVPPEVTVITLRRRCS